jgi:uncharacterized protein YyaL (SSP411 family)
MQCLSIHTGTNRRRLVLLCFLFSALSACHSGNKNHLANASSPYLQEHADNPVNWYEWGDEALEAAKKENKPLLISIGYSACHWCHVMEKESFMDTAVARIMNENFICIKVDREERPDIDNIYISACQLLSGDSGWPLNAFALPDGKPFFAGTYYPKSTWMSLLKNIASAYKKQNRKVTLQAQALANGIANLELSELGNFTDQHPDTRFYNALFDSLYQQLDIVHGGLKGSPKFPLPTTIEFLLQYHFLTKDKKALDAASVTLTQMAVGGIYDHVGGGFARYATDSLWRVPHFEKMLYDNAQLLSVYAHAFQLTGNIFYKNISQEIAAFIDRDLAAPGGGFYSSLNADTKEGEGLFYTWRYAEIHDNAALKHADWITSYYHISPNGNWEKYRNILYAGSAPADFAVRNGIDTTAFSNALQSAKKVLLTERSKRDKPATDDKILTSWNALALRGYLDAYAAFGEEKYLQTALANARFLERNMLEANGHLWRNWNDEHASIDAFLEDYVLLARAFIRLYELTFDKHWLLTAKKIIDYSSSHFYDSKSGLFFYTSDHSDSAVIRKVNMLDDVLPASNAVMAEDLYLLNVYFEDDAYGNRCDSMMSRLYDPMRRNETSRFMSWCMLAGMLSFGGDEVVVTGPAALSKNLALQKNYLPISHFMGSEKEENLPLLVGKVAGNRTMIYVCTNRTCKRPVEDVDSALKQVRGGDR